MATIYLISKPYWRKRIRHPFKSKIISKNIQQQVLDGLNPKIMAEIFKLKKHNYSNRKCQLTYPNPRTETYGLQSFGYRSCQLWDSLPNEI